jgi:predicted NBD/HSP70 family sugar kinase
MTATGQSEALVAAKTLSAARVVRAGEVLDLVRRGRAQTTSELAELMGLARSTVADRIELLTAHDLLRSETQEEPVKQRGRPASKYVFNPGAGLALAAQLGISGARVAVTDLNGTVLSSSTIDIDITAGPYAVLGRLLEQFDRDLGSLEANPSRIHGLCVGLPSRIELASHPQLSEAAPGSWDVPAVADFLTARFNVPVFVDHDVNVLAFGEYRARWSSAETMICIKAGTVIGCGIVVNGALLKGAQGLAGEIGHTRVRQDETPCICGNIGCLNAVAGGGAIARRLQAEGLNTPTTRSVVALANTGNVRAGQAVRAAGRDIGEVLASAVNLMNPALISVWGYLGDASDQLFAGIQESISRLAVAGAGRVRVEAASMGENAGIYGAAMMVVEHALAPGAVESYLLSQFRGTSSQWRPTEKRA